MHYILIFLVCLSCVHTPTPTSSPTSVVASGSGILSSPFLWKIDKPGEATSYLFGSMHCGIPAKDLPANVWSLLNAAPTVLLEVDFAQDKEALQKVIFTYKGSLKKELSTTAWDRLSEVVGRVVPAEKLEHINPLFAEIFYVTLVYPEYMSDCGHGMDHSLWQHAKQAGKDLVFLEDASMVANIQFTEKDIKALDETLRLPLGDLEAQSIFKKEEISFVYHKGELPELERVIRENGPSFTMWDSLIGQRNKTWLKKLLPALEKGSSFVVVGVAHMTGPESILKLLEAQGWRVTRENN